MRERDCFRLAGIKLGVKVIEQNRVSDGDPVNPCCGRNVGATCTHQPFLNDFAPHSLRYRNLTKYSLNEVKSSDSSVVD